MQIYFFQFSVVKMPQYNPKSATGLGRSSSKSNVNSVHMQPSNRMLDLKMCLMDFMRINTNSAPKQKKSPKPNGTKSHFMTYADSNVIYFNENMSMTSKSSTIKFSRYPTGNFSPEAKPMSITQPPTANRSRSIRHWMCNNNVSPFTSNAIPMSDGCFGCPTAVVESKHGMVGQAISSTSNSPVSDSSMRETETDDYVNHYSDYTTTNVGANSGLDSFCTLCTSSFSYNRCNRCEESSCSSKCDAAIGDIKPKKNSIDEGIAGGAATTSSENETASFG